VGEVRVVKRDGTEEPFLYEKVVVSCLKSGATPESARKIAKIVEARILEKNLERVTAKELTAWILELPPEEGERGVVQELDSLRQGRQEEGDGEGDRPADRIGPEVSGEEREAAEI
jgi:2-phosphoglycerate kinase